MRGESSFFCSSTVWFDFIIFCLFGICYEMEKKSSLVTCALSARSYTYDTDSLCSCRGVTWPVCIIGARFGSNSTRNQTSPVMTKK